MNTLQIVLVVLLFLLLVYTLGIRRWFYNWGAMPEEIRCPFPGDDLVAAPKTINTRAVTVHAPREAIWAWLVQIGQDRGGFYAYTWLENLFGMDIHNADRVNPAFQHLSVGDSIPFWRGVGVKVIEVQAPGLLVLGGSMYSDGLKPVDVDQPLLGSMGGTWVFLIEAVDEHTSRLMVRSQIAHFRPPWLCWLILRLLEPAHFIMERKMMQELKKRAERLRPVTQVEYN